MSAPDLEYLEQLLEEWESIEEDQREAWLEALRASHESTWAVFKRMVGRTGQTRVESISRRMWTSLDMEAGRIGQSIHQYSIRNVVDGGGMGIVYQAWDRRLNRMVALKFLRQDDLDSDEAIERFIKEARASAALDHPNICGIFEVEKAPDGAPFFAMPWYDGHTVAELLDQGPLSPDVCRSVLSQTAQGLRHAHQHGLVHCDIKPGNLFVTTEGRVKILDFGIVQLVENRGETSGGAIMGTLPYMCPQRLGGQPCTAQSDLWSLGVVGYEMLTGEKPFPGSDRQGLQQEIITGPAKLPSRTPVDLRRLVEALLEQDPEDRPDSAEWVSDLLERQPASSQWKRVMPAAAVLLVVLWVFGTQWFGNDELQILELEPFRIESSDVDSGLASGLHESLMLRAGQLPDISIRRGSSADDPSDTSIDPTWRLGGSFGPDSRLDLVLMDVTLSEPVWRASMPYDSASWVGLEQAIMEQLSERLEVERQLDTEVALARPAAIDEAAFEHYLRGLNLLSQRTPGQLELAIFEFQEATMHDPDYGAAFASLAEALALDASSGYAETQGTTGMLQAESAADRALELDPLNPTAHFTKGFILHEYHWQWSEAAGHFEEALALNPSNAEALHLYATHLAEMGDLKKALVMQNRARSLSPGTPIYHANYAQLLFMDRRYEEVLEYLDRLDPVLAEFYIARLWRSWALVESGRLDEAEVAVEQLSRVLGPNPLVLCLKGILMARMDREGASRELALQIESTSPTLAAAVHLELRDTDRALTLLDRGFEIRDAYLTIIGSWPGTDPVRTDPRFVALLERMNLSGE